MSSENTQALTLECPTVRTRCNLFAISILGNCPTFVSTIVRVASTLKRSSKTVRPDLAAGRDHQRPDNTLGAGCSVLSSRYVISAPPPAALVAPPYAAIPKFLSVAPCPRADVVR